jgi:hypothetical protein
MEKKNTINQEPQKTYAQVASEMNWGGVTYYSDKPQEKNENSDFLSVDPNVDKYLTGMIPRLPEDPADKENDADDSPRPEGLPDGISLADIARLAELFRS